MPPETAELEINSDEPCQTTVIEQQIQVKVLTTDGHPLLPGDKGEIGSEFQQEALQFAKNRRLKIAFAVGVL
jgi:hypothetical protein